MKKNIIKILPLLFVLTTANTYAASLSIDMISGGGIENSLSSGIGSSFNIDIIVDAASDFAGFEFDLDFDNIILNATLITSGDIFGPDTFSLENQINTNSIGFSETTLAFSGIDIFLPTVLATISFDVVGAGADFLNFSNVILSDSFGFEITPVSLNSGSLTTPSAVPVPSALILIISGFIPLIFRKRKRV